MKTVKAILTGVTVLMLAGPAMAQAVIDQRETNQQERIGQGVKSGQLTPGEARRLERGEGRIQRVEGRDLEKNGKLTPHEKRQLTRMENRESRRIYHAKHNAKHR